MSRISAAVSEITRVAWWSLRALGCPLGAVERMAKVMVFSEILEGGCLTVLRRDEAQLSASFMASEPQFARKSAALGVVGGAGRTFLDVGPRVIDVLTGIARSGNTVRMRVHSVADLLGLAGACVLAAGRGISVLSIRRAGESSDRLEWALYFITPEGIRQVSGETDGGEAAIHRTLHSLPAHGGSFPAIPEAAQPGGHHESVLVVDLIGFVPGAIPLLADDIPANLRATDVSAALHHAYANGIPVEEADLKFLYELEARTWAPTSERSRQQAGFSASVSTTAG